MAAPKVAKLAQIIKDLNPSYDPTRKIYNTQLSTLPGEETAALSGLNVAKTNAFGDITQGAQNRGMFYSGVPIAEQSRYVGEKFLPAVAGVKSNTLQRKFALQEALATLSKNQRSEAMGIREGQIKSRNDWINEQNKLALEQQKLQIAAMRASRPAAAKAPSQNEVLRGAASQLAGEMRKLAGRDGYVSPQTYAAARREWGAAGFGNFDQYFAGFKNPQNKNYQYF